jgi:hypothetical protein
MSVSQIIRREAKSVVTAIVANRDSMVDSYASTTSNASENLMESANPPAGLLDMGDSMFVAGASMADSLVTGKNNHPLLHQQNANNVQRGRRMSGNGAGAGVGSSGVMTSSSRYKRVMDASMTSSSAYLENARPPFQETDMDHSMVSIASITSEVRTTVSTDS